MFRILILALALVMTGCFTPRLRHSRSQKKAEEVVNVPQSAAPPELAVEAQTAAPPVEAAAVIPEIHPSNIVVSKEITFKESERATPPVNVHAIHEGVEPSKAMQWLKNGNKRFRKAWNRKDGKTKADVERLSSGQHPHTIVLSCADSRVPPEHVFDQGLGEIFTVRVAGEALDTSVIASIEYAALHLGSRLVLVMGHTQCGAVAATIDAHGRSPAGSPSLDRLVADIGPRVDYATPDNKTKDLYKESFDNAKGVAADLLSRSDILRELVAKGQVQVATAIYNLKTGTVDFE